eukprot:5573150-Prymnesium_polylepis.1
MSNVLRSSKNAAAARRTRGLRKSSASGNSDNSPATAASYEPPSNPRSVFTLGASQSLTGSDNPHHWSR